MLGRRGRAAGMPATVFLSAFALHLLNVGYAEWGTGLQSAYPESDAFIYLHKAWYQAFVASDGGFAARIVPFSPYVQLMRRAYTLLGPQLWTPLLVNALLASFAVVFSAVAVRRIFGPLEGWGAGLLGAFCGPVIFFAGVTVKTNLVVFLIALALYMVSLYFRRPRVLTLFLGMTLFGIAALDRHQLFVIVILLLAVAVWRSVRTVDFRQIFGTISAIVLSVASVVYITSWRGDDVEPEFFSPVGLNFYVGAAPGSWGGYTLIPGVRDSLIGHRADAALIAEKSAGKKLTREEISAYWIQRSLGYYQNHIGEYLRLQLRKLGLMFAQAAQGLPEEYRVWRWKRPALTIAVVDYGMLVALSLIGVMALKLRGARPMVGFLLAGTAIYMLSIAFFFVIERHRVSIIMFLLPFAGCGVAAVLKQRRIGLKAIYVGIFLALYSGTLALNALNHTGPGWTDDVEGFAQEEQARLKHELEVYRLKRDAVAHGSPSDWGRLAEIFNSRDFYPDAAVFAERAIKSDPKQVVGYRALFNIYLRRKDMAGLVALRRRIAQIEVPDQEKTKFARLLQWIELKIGRGNY